MPPAIYGGAADDRAGALEARGAQAPRRAARGARARASASRPGPFEIETDPHGALDPGLARGRAPHRRSARSWSPATTSSTRPRSTASRPTSRGSPSSAARACSASAATRPTPTGPGVAPSESSVGPALLEVFARCEGRIIVTCFASNVHRVQQVIDAAAQLDRRVALVGRSMRKNFNIASNLGHRRGARRAADPAEGDRGLPRRQGDRDLDRQPGRAALGAAADGARRPPRRRAALGRHGDLLGDADPRQRALGERDGRPHLPDRRPGGHRRRRPDPRLRPRLAGGAEADAQPDQAALRASRSTATTSGCACTPSSPSRSGSSRSASSRAATGWRSRSTSGGARFGEDVHAGMIFVDGVDIGEPDDVALRDRRMLSADGDLHRRRHGLLRRRLARSPTPEVIFRGVPFLEDEADGLVEELRDVVGTRSPRPPSDDVTRARAAPGGPPRRRRRVRLRAPAAAADGAPVVVEV